MILMLKPVDDGPLDINLKVGDIVFGYLDSEEGAIGNQEKKSWLAVKIPDPTNAQGDPFPAATLDAIKDDLQKRDYAAGASPESNVVRRERRHSIPTFRQQFSPDELTIIDDSNQMLPDGATAFGGTVVSGVVSGLFHFDDVVRK